MHFVAPYEQYERQTMTTCIDVLQAVPYDLRVVVLGFSCTANYGLREPVLPLVPGSDVLVTLDMQEPSTVVTLTRVAGTGPITDTDVFTATVDVGGTPVALGWQKSPVVPATEYAYEYYWYDSLVVGPNAGNQWVITRPTPGASTSSDAKVNCALCQIWPAPMVSDTTITNTYVNYENTARPSLVAAPPSAVRYQLPLGAPLLQAGKIYQPCQFLLQTYAA